MTSVDQWRDLLTRWSQELVGRPSLSQHLPPEVRSSGWLGFPPATDAQVREAEVRLRTTLPPSYREFLRTTNGWRSTGTFIDRIYPCDEIRWFRERNQQWIDAYVNPPLPQGWLRFLTGASRVDRLSDAEYFVYGDEQDPARFRPEYLQTALEISAEGDSAIYLLNPEVVTPDGEWEAWFFANWLPGASRYRSFWEMMVSEHESFLKLE